MKREDGWLLFRGKKGKEIKENVIIILLFFIIKKGHWEAWETIRHLLQVNPNPKFLHPSRRHRPTPTVDHQPTPRRRRSVSSVLLVARTRSDLHAASRHRVKPPAPAPLARSARRSPDRQPRTRSAPQPCQCALVPCPMPCRRARSTPQVVPTPHLWAEILPAQPPSSLLAQFRPTLFSKPR